MKPFKKKDFPIFESLLYRDLEKYCDILNIACCGKCYDSYVEVWPIAFDFNGGYFLKDSMELEYFYKNSRLSGIYTYKTFLKYMHEIECPNCGEPIENEFWPDNLPFRPNYTQVKNIQEISKIVSETPFLVLEHPYAKKVYRHIQQMAERVTPQKVGKVLYRARVIENKKPEMSDFLHPPRNLAKENRYNHYGMPALYLGENQNAVFFEMRSPKDGLYMADIFLEDKIKVLDLHEKLDLDENILQPLLWSSLMSSKSEGDGFSKPHYCFTRFVADCAKSAGFQGIYYPSVRYSESRNLVLLDPEKLKNTMSISNIRQFNKDSKTE